MKVDLQMPKDKASGGEESFKLRYGPSIRADERRKFAMAFEATVNLDEGHTLYVEYYSVFETSEEVSEEILDTNMVTMNAPAIAFPFLRAFIAQLTLLSGYKPLVLPSINFVERSKDPASRIRIHEGVSLAAHY